MLPRFAKDDEPIVGPKLGSSHVAGDHTFAIADNSHDGCPVGSLQTTRSSYRSDFE